MSGTLSAEADGQRIQIGPGETATFAAGSAHRWWNDGDETLVVDGYVKPAVDLDLGLTGAAKESKPAALALEMGPGAHKTRPLVRQGRQFNLQPALMSARPFPEYLENQPSPVDNLGLPATFEIALLHWAQCSINNGELYVIFADQFGEILDGAAAQKAARARA